jgi:hypothetical protein
VQLIVLVSLVAVGAIAAAVSLRLCAGGVWGRNS